MSFLLLAGGFGGWGSPSAADDAGPFTQHLWQSRWGCSASFLLEDKTPRPRGVQTNSMHGMCTSDNPLYCLSIATKSLCRRRVALSVHSALIQLPTKAKTLGGRLRPIKYMLLPSKSQIRCSERGRAHTAGIQVGMAEKQ